MWDFRALELNTQDFWNWDRACQLVDYACRHHFNTIVVGQLDLFDKLVTPPGYTPARYNDRVSIQQRARCIYLERLGQHCRQRGLHFYLQAKELSFPTEVLLSQPWLMDAANDVRLDIDFWSQYLADKITLICENVPSLSGLLVALSSTDSLLPISRTHWESLDASPRALPQVPVNSTERYQRFYNALSEVMSRQQRHLVLRLFPASISDMDPILEAIAPLPDSVSVSIKLTPERFWPEFPSNPALLAVNQRNVWVEIDLAGEEVGWGNFPFIRIDELQGRLLWCQARNPDIRGVLCKVSWEGVDNLWVIGSLSECNLVSLGYLLRDAPSPSTEQLLRHWLSECYGWHPDSETFATLSGLLENGHRALYHSLYVRDHVFHRHSLLPESVGQATWSLYGQLDRQHWLPGSGSAIQFSREDTSLSSQNLYQIAKEKDAALVLAREVREQALQFADTAGFPAALSHRWHMEWQGLALYCQMFVAAQKAFFTLHYARQVENNWSMREICQTNIQLLYSAASEMTAFCQQQQGLTPGFYVMFDPRRVRLFADSLSEELAALSR